MEFQNLITTKEKVIYLRQNGYTIPEICKTLNIGKGTVGFHLKGLNFKKEIKIKEKVNIIEDVDIFVFNKIQINKQDFLEAINKSTSIYDVLLKLNLNKTNYYYKVFDKMLEKWNMSRKDLNFQIITRKKKKNEDIFISNSLYKGTNTILKQKLYKAGLKQPICELCGQDENWNGKILKHHLDHINGINNDNRIENLRILCPNCHSQTETYCRKK